MCRAGSGLGGRGLDSVFIFQMVMMKTRKIHEFFRQIYSTKHLFQISARISPVKKQLYRTALYSRIPISLPCRTTKIGGGGGLMKGIMGKGLRKNGGGGGNGGLLSINPEGFGPKLLAAINGAAAAIANQG